MKKKKPQKGDAVKRPVTSAMEDYLEAIYDLDQGQRVVRVKDIAERLHVKMPTVTSMLKSLGERGLVNYRKYEYVELTDSGVKVGREMHRRHALLYKFLTDILKVGPKKANEEACKMEHALSPATLDRFADFMDFIHACPRAGENWLDHFQDYRRHGRQPDKCLEQTETFSCEFKEKVDSLKQCGSCNAGG